MTNNEKKLIELCEEMIDLNHIENGFKDFPELSRIKRELATLRAEAAVLQSIADQLNPPTTGEPKQWTSPLY